MSAEYTAPVVYRKLRPNEMEMFADHLLRLDRESRHMRFGHTVSDSFIRTYADMSATLGGVVHGCFIDGVLRAAAELRPVSEIAPHTAEAAFSVEADHQNAGLGSALMGRLILSAQNRKIRTLVMHCLLENGRMRAVARKHRAVLSVADGEVTGSVMPPSSSALSKLKEKANDVRGLIGRALSGNDRLIRG